MTARISPPFHILVAAAADAPIGQLAQHVEVERLIVTACVTEEEAQRSLAAGIPDLGILDGSLPGASLLRVYSALRPEQLDDQIPILITSHAMDAAPAVEGVPDVYLAADADLEAIRNALYRSLGLPIPEPRSRTADPLVTNLLSGLRDGGFDAATYGSAASVLKELKDGLPAAAVLDARLPQAELSAVYRSIRERPDGADLPVLFIHDPKCPPGAIVRNGSDLYLGEGASIDEALAAIKDKVFNVETPAAPGPMEPELVPTKRPRFRLPTLSFGGRNPLTKKALRALPIAAMIVIGGVAGVMTVRTFDTRSWPLAHPIEASASNSPVVPTATIASVGPTETPLQALATRAALSGSAPRSPRVTPEVAGCALLPAFESLRELVGADTIGTCTDQPTIRENGDAQQATTKGLFAFRRNEDWTAFTDGHRTWVKGPNGVQQRLNTERFPWESTSAVFDEPAVAMR